MPRGTPKLTPDKNWNGKEISRNEYFLIAFFSKFITSWSSGFEKFLRFINSAYKRFNKHFGTSWTRLKIIIFGQFLSSAEHIFKVCV